MPAEVLRSAQGLDGLASTVNKGAHCAEYQRDGQCYAGDTLEELHELIERDLVPVLVVEGHEQFNIVRYLGKYYGVAQSLGPVDLAQLRPMCSGRLSGQRSVCRRPFLGRSQTTNRGAATLGSATLPGNRPWPAVLFMPPLRVARARLL